ncbi:MAG: hypothetical protein L0G99_11890, partial [Propionibacteriales bacterium]|nr:hypothetical protein [Propionibacteriales bacterium]
MTSIPRRTVLLGATVAVAAGATPAMARASTAVRPLDQAHAHNDYEHDRPLLNALDNGFTSVEADVWLVGDELYVGHDGPDLTRTLRSLYLDPLRRRIRGNRQRVFRDRDAPIRLLVDVKSPEPAAYDVINKQLSAYPELITVWRNGRRFDRAV